MTEIAMEKCPKCNRENYCMMVMQGQCAWCGYEAQESDIGKQGVWKIREDVQKL